MQGVLLPDDLSPRTHGLLGGSPLLANDGVPMRVAITSDPGLASQGLSIYGVDGPAFIRRAFELASETGRRRVGVLWHTDWKSSWQPEIDRVMALAAEKNLALTRRHIQVPAMRDPASIYHCVYGLLDDAPEHRPEVLVISDDNLVGDATKAIVQAGVRVPRELRVIAHCTYPAVLAGGRTGDTAGIRHSCDAGAVRRDFGVPPHRRWHAVD